MPIERHLFVKPIGTFECIACEQAVNMVYNFALGDVIRVSSQPTADVMAKLAMHELVDLLFGEVPMYCEIETNERGVPTHIAYWYGKDIFTKIQHLAGGGEIKLI